ncbi:MAG: hypothetical protein RL088_453 [Verrucomicrobiota bacterium]|jgi:hypothetical protein
MRAILRINALILTLLVPACVNPGTAAQRRLRATSLATDLTSLSKSVHPSEATLLAQTAVEESARLSTEFRPMHIAWLNNNLVNSGVLDRGLCWHWRDDLFPRLFALKLRTFDLHLASARRGTSLEHNAIVVTPRAGRFEEGIVLDPWRRGGVLVWKRVADDRYPWEPLPPELTPDSLRPLLMPEGKVKHRAR